MRSRALRTTCGAIAWIAVGLAAFFLFRSEKQLTELGAAVRAFDLHAREVSTSLDDLRAGQQAYVAAGQGVAFWMPKVAATTDAARTGIAPLRGSALSST